MSGERHAQFLLRSVALNSRDKGCRFPGCTHTRYVDGHHIQHWADGGETRLGNLVLLCRFHHRLVHEGGVSVHVLDDGALQFLKPNGRPFEDMTAEIGRIAGDWTQLVATHHQQVLDIDAKTAVTRWRGKPMDYDLAVQALLQRAKQAYVALPAAASLRVGRRQDDPTDTGFGEAKNRQDCLQHLH